VCSYDKTHNVRPRRNIRMAMQHGERPCVLPSCAELQDLQNSNRVCVFVNRCALRDVDVRHRAGASSPLKHLLIF
jgi:hypothetical protein